MRLRTAHPTKTAAGGLLALVLSLASAVAAVHTTDLKFTPSQFRIEPATGGSQLAEQTHQVVLGEGMDVTDEVGAPQLPVEPVVIALPGHQRVANATFEVGEWEALKGEHLVLPCQKQQVLSAEAGVAEVTQPDAAIYESYLAYPAAPVRLTGVSYRGKRGQSLGALGRAVQSPSCRSACAGLRRRRNRPRFPRQSP